MVMYDKPISASVSLKSELASFIPVVVCFHHRHNTTSATMAARNGTEAASLQNERDPLLQHDRSPDATGVPSDDDGDDVPPSAPSKWRWLWLAISMVLGAGLAALFIKGWIDADDTDVSLVTTIHVLSTLIVAPGQFDLAGALERALGGGVSGAAAMVLQVLLLMVNITNSGIELD